MKLIIAVVDKGEAGGVTSALTCAGFASTMTDSKGGFFDRENTLVLTGVDDFHVQRVLQIISDNTNDREVGVPEDIDLGDFKLPERVKIGGAVAFVVGLDQFVKL